MDSMELDTRCNRYSLGTDRLVKVGTSMVSRRVADRFANASFISSREAGMRILVGTGG